MLRSRANFVVWSSAVASASFLFCACQGTITTPNDGAEGRSLGPDGLPVAGPNGIASHNVAGSAGANAVGPNGLGNGAATPSNPAGAAAAAIAPLRCVTPDVGPSPLRRLTHDEYDNAVRDLLADSTQPGRDFAPDTQIGLFDNTASAQTVPELLADQYLSSAEKLAQSVSDVKTLAGCDPATGSSCIRSFAQRFGRRAYRRPLTSDELDQLVQLESDTAAASDAATGVRAVVTAVLVSPNFLFKPEFGAESSSLPNAKQLTPFELAERLSTLLWASIPDDTLLDDAANGKLATRDDLAREARRMLADDRAHAAIVAFYQQWLGLPLLDAATKDATIYPDFNDALKTAMGEETRRFIDYVLWQDDAKFTTLVTAPYSFVNSSLAKLYAVSGPKDPATYQRVMLDATQRAGFLTQPSLMTIFASPQTSSPIKRGKLVRVRLLCQDLPDPPANVPPPPPPQQGVSTRERFAMHTNNPACSGCHHLIDGLGFGLEHYDGIGAYRTMDLGVAVDASGEINTTEDIDGPYSGGPQLAGLLAKSQQVRDCVPTQWLRYALARRETDADTCSLVALRDAFAKSGGDLRELMVALTQTDAFWNYRGPE